MYGPVIFLLCARPGDDLVGASAAILRAREQGCIVTSFMLSTGLTQQPRWKFWSKGNDSERAENLLNTTRRIAADYGHQFVGWNTARGAGTITPNLPHMARDIERAFVNIKPDIVWTPAFLGLDPDYDAVNLIASRLPQLATSPVDIYEYIPRPMLRPSMAAGGGRTHMVFPNRMGMELMLNLTVGESSKRLRALDSLRQVYDEKLPTDNDRELFRLLPVHDYARPPYGYKNALMLRGSPPGAVTAKAVIPRYLAMQRTPVSRAVHATTDQAGTPLHHLPQG